MPFRDATIEDIPALLELENACYPPRQAYTRAEYHYAVAVARAVNLVREDMGVVTGFVGAFHHRGRRTGNVYTVNVHPKERGKGLGRGLLEACEERLRALGMRRIVLEVNVENTAAMALYGSCGYRRVARLEDYYTQYDDNDAWRYEKDL